MPVTIRHIDDLARGGALNDHPWDVVVVIDVIRAFTAAAWVLMQGASALFLAPDAETALAARADRYPDALLMKDGAPDPRFDLPNAPGRIAQEDLTGRVVIQTTGNGTAAAHAVRDVPTVLCAAFTTAGATLEAMRRHHTILLVPTEGDEDQALAEYLSESLTASVAVDPHPYLARVASCPAGLECRERGADPAFRGVHRDDLRLCTQIDTFPHALQVRPQGTLLQADVL